MRLTLSRKMLVVVTVPVLFELFLVGTLLSMIHDSEGKRVHLAHQKEVISRLNSIMALHLRRLCDLVLGNTMNLEAPRIRARRTADKILEEIAAIDRIVPQLPEENFTWTEVKQLIATLDKTGIEARAFYDSGDKLKGYQTWLQMEHAVDKLLTLIDDLSIEQMQHKEEQELALESLYKHQEMILYLSLGVSLLTAFGLAVYFNRGTTDRLQKLTETAQLLAAGQAPLAKLSGNDELTAIDKTLHTMHRDLSALRRKERAILDNAADIICSIDEDGRIADINQAGVRLFACPLPELLGRRAMDLICEDEREVVHTKIRNTMSSKSETRLECRVKRADGTMADTAWSLTFSPEENLLSCVVHDISQQRALDRLKRDFVAMVSHDLRTPLTSIQLVMELVEGEGKNLLKPSTLENLVMVQNNTNRLLALVNNLLDLDKLEEGKLDLAPEETNLKEVVQSAVNALNAIAVQRKLEIVCAIDEQARAFIDKERIIQVLINLLSNAIKFSPAGSQIRIDAHETDGHMLRVTVQDEGRGVPDQMRTAIFDRFKQVDRSDAQDNKGSGLGLAICKAIVEAHGGAIGVEGKEGGGSVFWFTIPTREIRERTEAKTTTVLDNG